MFWDSETKQIQNILARTDTKSHSYSQSHIKPVLCPPLFFSLFPCPYLQINSSTILSQTIFKPHAEQPIAPLQHSILIHRQVILMSNQHRDSRSHNNITLAAPVAASRNQQFIGEQLSDIPAISLGPSLYDYVRIFEDNNSSICSSSHPGTPPPNPIAIDQHLNGSGLYAAQLPLYTPTGEQNQDDSHTGNAGPTSSSDMSHNAQSPTSENKYLPATSESLQVSILAQGTAAIQDSIDAKPINTNILRKDILRKSTAACTLKSSKPQDR